VSRHSFPRPAEGPSFGDRIYGSEEFPDREPDPFFRARMALLFVFSGSGDPFPPRFFFFFSLLVPMAEMVSSFTASEDKAWVVAFSKARN